VLNQIRQVLGPAADIKTIGFPSTELPDHTGAAAGAALYRD
jgi:hypothetical protein